MPVPPRGSIQDRVLQETIQRERFQVYQQHTFLGRIFASALGLDTRQLARAEELLSLAIFQTAYDPQQIQDHMLQVERALRAEREERLRDARIMARVASYTEPDEDDATEFPMKKTTQTRFHGVTTPWAK